MSEISEGDTKLVPPKGLEALFISTLFTETIGTWHRQVPTHGYESIGTWRYSLKFDKHVLHYEFVLSLYEHLGARIDFLGFMINEHVCIVFVSISNN